jgi:hypothetical protein
LNKRLSQVFTTPVTGSDQQWEAIAKEFDRIENNRDNKIPLSEFESKYSKFFNAANIELLGSSISIESGRWKQDSEDFLKRIDPYQPFMVVSDTDRDHILKVFPPIFRRVNALTPDSETGKQASSIMDENGVPMTVKEVTSICTTIFERLGTDANVQRQLDALLLMKQGLHVTQNRKAIMNDIACTDFIIKNFDDPDVIIGTKEPDVENNEERLSAEDCGVVFLDDD